jgi:hypothetical protein
MEFGDRTVEGHAATGRTEFVLVGSPDVAGSIGRGDFLATRLAASRPDAPPARVRVVPPVRLDVLAQQLTLHGMPDAIEVPPALEDWWVAMASAPRIGLDTAALVISVADALRDEVWRHPDHDIVVQPPAGFRTSWSPGEIGWLMSEFEPAVLDDGRIDEALKAIVDRASGTGAEMLAFNVSTYLPDGSEHNHAPGSAERGVSLAHRLDLALDRLAGTLDLHVLDVDRIVAEHGAAGLVTAPGIYADEMLDVIASEAADALAALPAVSGTYGPDVMGLTVPAFDRRTRRGTLVGWQMSAPADIVAGQHLFDVQFKDLLGRVDGREARETGRSLFVSVHAVQDGCLREIVQPDGSQVRAGDLVGVVVKAGDIEPGDVSAASPFPVGVRVPTRDGEV